MTAFGTDIDQFLRECFELDPLRATAAGMHAHDARWPDVTEAGRLKRLEFGDRWDRRLAAHADGSLTPDERIDRDLLRMELAAERFAESTLREDAWDPLSWVYLLGAGIFPLLAREFAPLDARLTSVAGRLDGVPAIVAALRDNRLGVDLRALHPSLAGTAPRDWLPAQPPQVVFARHTVGLLDPIEENEIAPDERVNDGLPQSLAACVRFYGLRHFKIKIDADVTRAKGRLRKIAAVLRRECGGDFAFSLDGNESFRDPAVFASQMRALLAEPALKEFWPKLLFIEQPLHRDVALTPAADWSAWPERPPIIIDESDGELDAFVAANPRGKHGQLAYDLQGDFGLDPDTVRARFDYYFERFPVAVESSPAQIRRPGR